MIKLKLMLKRKLILYISCTLDGYVAKPGDDLSFLEKVQKEGEDYGYQEFSASVDTVIVGRKTYEWVINQGYEYPHNDKEVYVLTRTSKPKDGNIVYYSGDIKTLLEELKDLSGKNIYCDGGASIVHEMLKLKLIDEMIISIIPILVGDGVRLFEGGRPEQDLELISSKKYESGLVQVHYGVGK